MTATAPRNYHHGDLRNALIVAAAQLIEESGSLNFTMADTARRAGVSSAAPYRHFRDKDDLLEAVTHLGFIALRNSSKEVMDRQTRGSMEAIIALGENYIRFLIAKAPFYDLMWGALAGKAMDSENFDRRESGFYVLEDAVKAYFDAARVTEVDVLDVAIKLWALVHGFAVISMGDKLRHFHPNADVMAMLDSATRTFLQGLTDDKASS